jgi:hypothetical protein
MTRSSGGSDCNCIAGRMKCDAPKVGLGWSIHTLQLASQLVDSTKSTAHYFRTARSKNTNSRAPHLLTSWCSINSAVNYRHLYSTGTPAMLGLTFSRKGTTIFWDVMPCCLVDLYRRFRRRVSHSIRKQERKSKQRSAILLARLTLLPWRWRQYIHPKCRKISTRLHGVKFQHAWCLFLAWLAYNLILKIVAVRSSETPINFYQTTRRQVPEDRILHTNYGSEQVGLDFHSGGAQYQYRPGHRDQSLSSPPHKCRDATSDRPRPLLSTSFPNRHSSVTLSIRRYGI